MIIQEHSSFWAVYTTSILAGIVIGLTIAQFLVVDEQLSWVICWITLGFFLIDLIVFAVYLWRIYHDN